MSSRSLLSLTTFLLALQLASAARRPRYKLVEPQRWKASSELVFAEPALTLPLKRAKSKSPSQKYLQTIVAPTTNQTSVFSDAFESSYTTDITFGDQTLTAIVDTGSSDTWVVQNNFTCLDSSGNYVDPSTCSFGPTYRPGGTFRQIQDQNFITVYGDGEMLSGILGYETVTLANITVPQQEIALINTAYYEGDGIISALIGLAYPNLTSAYPGVMTSPDDISFANSLQYTPLFTSMYQKTGIAPVFSLALSRDNDTGGLLAFGGLPTGVSYDGDFTVAPIKLMQVTQNGTTGTDVSYIYTYYAIAVQSIDLRVPGSVSSSSSAAVSSPMGGISSTTVLLQHTSVTTASNELTSLTTTFTLIPNDSTTSTCTELKSPVITPDPDLTNPESQPDFGTSTSPVAPASTYQPPGTWWRSRMKRNALADSSLQARQARPLVYIVDSGTTLIYAPDPIAQAINDAFDPPAYYDTYTGEYFVDCDAIAPEVTVQINGTVFSINPADLILHNVTPRQGAGADPNVPTPCGSGVAAAGQGGLYVLGDVFLRNVLAVFDVGAGEMRFAARNY